MAQKQVKNVEDRKPAKQRSQAVQPRSKGQQERGSNQPDKAEDRQ
jgi:hypothetical protein